MPEIGRDPGAGDPAVHWTIFGHVILFAVAIHAPGLVAAARFASTLSVQPGTPRVIAGAGLGFAVSKLAGFAKALAGRASLPVTKTTLVIGRLFFGVIQPGSEAQAPEEQGDIAGPASSLGARCRWPQRACRLRRLVRSSTGPCGQSRGALGPCGLLALVPSRLIPCQAALV
jgi:DHA1 family bicyclomycin/chloramphenicol resistance-like MFS transporter